MNKKPSPKLLCMVDLSYSPEAEAVLEQYGNVDVLPSDRGRLLEIINEYDAVWCHTELRIDKEVLDRAGRLKVINTASTGTDHIDKEEAARRGIRILSITKDYGLLDGFTGVAEVAWMLIIACRRNFRKQVGNVLAGGWTDESICGDAISPQTVGVLGVGRLGRMAAEIGKAFRMRVLACDPTPFSISGVLEVDFDTLLAESDVITVHIHLTPENYHLFDADVFSRMKDGASLVNTSRGDVVDEEALIHALDSGKLHSFGADVIHDEWRTDMRESALVRYAMEHENVIILPHMGGGRNKTAEARAFSARKVVRYLESGEELTWPREGVCCESP